MTQAEKDARKAIHAQAQHGIEGLEKINQREERTMTINDNPFLARVPDAETAATLISLLDCWFGAHWYTTNDPDSTNGELLIHRKSSTYQDTRREDKARYFCLGFLHGLKGDK